MVCSNGNNKVVFVYASADGIRWEGVPGKPLSTTDDTMPTGP